MLEQQKALVLREREGIVAGIEARLPGWRWEEPYGLVEDLSLLQKQQQANPDAMNDAIQTAAYPPNGIAGGRRGISVAEA